jgi:hypothetical protein
MSTNPKHRKVLQMNKYATTVSIEELKGSADEIGNRAKGISAMQEVLSNPKTHVANKHEIQVCVPRNFLNLPITAVQAKS